MLEGLGMSMSTGVNNLGGIMSSGDSEKAGRQGTLGKNLFSFIKVSNPCTQVMRVVRERSKSACDKKSPVLCQSFLTKTTI